MTKSAVYGYSPIRAELTAYIADLAATGRPFFLTSASSDISRGHHLILETLQRMDAAGLITLECRHRAGLSRYRITLPDGTATIWPAENTQHKVLEDEIVARRRQLEAEREAKRRYWLERERAPRLRDQPRDHLFLDKATVMALQGARYA